MAAPVDQDRALTNSTTSGTSHSLNLPASIASGDILLAVVRCPGSTTITWPAGWTEQEQSNADSSDDETSIAWRIADGTEGATITITLGTSRILVGLCYRVTGGVDVAFSGALTGSGSQPNSSIITPDGVTHDVLSITIGGCDDSETLTNPPTNYVNGTIQGSTATGATGCSVYGASRQLTAASSEDPGAWTLGSTSIWTAWTVWISETDFGSRFTQAATEALIRPTDGQGRFTQGATEVVVRPTDQRARFTQAAVEVLVRPIPYVAPSFQAYIID